MTSLYISKNKFIFVLVLVILLLPNFFLLAGTELESEHKDRIIIKYKNQDDLVLRDVLESENSDDLISYYESQENVDFAELDYVYRASIIPSDTHYGSQWYLKKIRAEEAWNVKREANDIVVAVIDSGVQINHPDLKDNIWRNEFEIPDNGIDDDKNGFIDDVSGWDFVNNTADPNPKFAEGFTVDGIIHGTIVAGVLAGYGNNGTGISGVVWQTNIMPLKVLNDKGEGDTSSVIRAIDYASNNGADVINLSFIGFGYSQALENAIRRAYNKGIVIVAAAGNDMGEGNGVNIDERAIYPACHDGALGENMVIGVSATDPLDQKAGFSSYGSKCVDLAAPGVSIYSTSVYSPEHSILTERFDAYYDGFWSGTSMAAPMVSGAVALIESVNPRLSQKGVKDVLLSTTDNINLLNPGYWSKLGSGRLNVQSSVQKAKSLIDQKQTLLMIGGERNIDPILNITDKNGSIFEKFEVFNKNFQGGIHLASGDVDGDGEDEIVVGAGKGGGPHIRIFKKNGTLLGQFFAYDGNFRGGVNVSCGDVNGDGVDEIIAGAGQGGGPHIRIFKLNGTLFGNFFAYDKNFRGGVNVAVGDVNGDGMEEIIAGAGKGGGPHVRIFGVDGSLVSHFFAYDENFRGGVNVASAYYNSGSNGNKASVVTSPGEGGEPHVVIYDMNGNMQDSFYAFSKKFKGGVNLATGDFDNDGYDEIVVAAGQGGAPHVRIFSNKGVLLNSFYAYNENYSEGVSVHTLDVTNIIF